MRHTIQAILTAACGLSFTHLANADSGPETHYRVIILDAAGRGNSINDLGIVAGRSKTQNGTVHATIWAFGHKIDLGTLGQGTALNSTVQWPAKNNLGLVSGLSLTDAPDPNQEGWSCAAFLSNPTLRQCLGFVWDPFTSRMHALNPLPGGTNSFATGTNDLAETVGWAENGVRDSSCVAPQVLQFRPVRWGPAHEIHELPVLQSDSAGKATGDTTGAATAVNDRGQIVGISGACGVAVGGVSARHAVIWDNGGVEEIVNPNGALYWNTPMMINRRGDVVGFAGVPDDPDGNFTPPFMWSRRGGWQWIPLPVIGTPSGGIQDIAGVATSINSKRQIVGYSNDSVPHFHAWIWQNGMTRDLNDLIAGESVPKGSLRLAFDINERGEITGATTSGQAFLAVPVNDEE